MASAAASSRWKQFVGEPTEGVPLCRHSEAERHLLVTGNARQSASPRVQPLPGRSGHTIITQFSSRRVSVTPTLSYHPGKTLAVAPTYAHWRPLSSTPALTRE